MKKILPIFLSVLGFAAPTAFAQTTAGVPIPAPVVSGTPVAPPLTTPVAPTASGPAAVLPAPATPALPPQASSVANSAQVSVPGAVAVTARTLVLGSTGADVTALQKSLIASGYPLPSGATGYFGAQTKAAVIAFQKANGIAPLGTVGPQTQTALNKGAVAATPASSAPSSSSATSQSSTAPTPAASQTQAPSSSSAPTASSASSGPKLSSSQISSIIGILQSFGANAATIAQVQAALQ